MTRRVTRVTGFTLLLSNILLETSAQVCFKLAATPLAPAPTWTEVLSSAFDSPWLLLGYLFQASQLPVWLACLARLELSLAFPLMALSQLVLVFVSWLILGQPVSALHLGGGVVVLAGSALLLSCEEDWS